MHGQGRLWKALVGRRPQKFVGGRPAKFVERRAAVVLQYRTEHMSECDEYMEQGHGLLTSLLRPARNLEHSR